MGRHENDKTRRRVLLAIPSGLAALAAGCASDRDQVPADIDIPAAFRASPEGAKAAWPTVAWWKGFGSPALNALIDQAQRANFDIAAAIARVSQADAQVRVAGAALLPALNGDASAGWNHIGFGTGANGIRAARGNGGLDTRSYSFGLSASYQFDFWGHNRARRRAAIASAMFSRFDQRTVALTVVTNVASTWFTALALADRLAVARRNVADTEQTLAVIKGRLEAGTASALDVASQDALVAAERATIPNFTSQLEQAVIGLGILTGQPPERITVQPGTLTALSLPVVNPGLPSALLMRRPDVAAAEAQLQASGFDVTVARTAFYPAVNLTGSGGYQAAALNALVNPGGAIASLAAGMTAPLFDGGMLRGALEQARGRQAELLADYRKSVVQAFTDVDNALVGWRYTSEQETLQRTAMETARRAAMIARAQMLAGTADITAVLTAESALFNAEDTLAQVRLSRCLALLNLYKALGGGWTAEETGKFPGLAPNLIKGGIAVSGLGGR